MQRVVKRHGRVALSLWCNIEENAYFHALVGAVAHHIDAETAAGLRAAFALSNASEIRRLLAEAGFRRIEMAEQQLDLPLPGMHAFVPRHIGATPMAVGFNLASESVQQAIVQEVTEKLSPYEVNRHMRIPFRSHMIIGTK